MLNEKAPRLLIELDEYLNVISERERKLLNLLNEPRTFENIIDAWIIYGKPREPEAEFKLIEAGYMKKHLELLDDEDLKGIYRLLSTNIQREHDKEL